MARRKPISGRSPQSFRRAPTPNRISVVKGNPGTTKIENVTKSEPADPSTPTVSYRQRDPDMVQAETPRVKGARASQTVKKAMRESAYIASEQLEGGEELRESASVIYGASVPVSKAGQALKSTREKKIAAEKKKQAIHTVSYRAKSIVNTPDVKSGGVTYSVSRKQAESKPAITKKGKKGSDPRYTKKRDRRKRRGKRRRKKSSKKATPIGLRERLIHAFRVRDAEEDAADASGSVTKGATGFKRILLLVLHVIKTLISLILLPVFIVLGIVVVIVALIIGIIMLIIYCSPLSIFFPQPDTGTPDIRAVLSGYYQEFNAEISSYEADGTTVTFQNTENGTYVSNFRDTLMVYMTLYSDGTTGFVMDDNGKANLKKVFDEMNYIEKGRSERQIKVGESLGKVYVTAYCPCRECSGPHGHATASGKKAKEGRTVAVDAYDPIVPMGTKVVIDGHVYTVEDTGDLHKYGNEFDIFYEKHEDTGKWGRRKVEVYVADKDGKIKNPDKDDDPDTDRGEPDTGNSSGGDEGETITVSSEGITVHNLTYLDYIEAHPELNEDQKKMLDLLMNEESSIYGAGSGIGEQAVALGMTKIGCRYSQARRYDEGYYDCSSFVMRIYGELGLELPGTAAEQGRYCAEQGMIINQKDLRPGDLIFYSYEKNDRYKNISHVAMYAGDGKMIHAANPRRGVVMDPLRTGSVVFYGRPYLG